MNMALNRPIIAVVDDDKIFQLTASRIIKSAAISEQILQFENGEQALRFLRENSAQSDRLPDYVFLDINMPFIDGWMFLEDFEQLKVSLPKPITIYMVSSSIDPQDMNRAESNPNVKEYLLKPVSREKFIELLLNRAA